MDAETPATRLKMARQSVGLDQHAVAALSGINSPHIYDLEGYEDELASTLSLEKLCKLAEVVRTDPLFLLIGDQANAVERSIQFADIVQNLAAQMAAADLDVEQLGERVGRELTKILANPQELWELSSDGFFDVAKSAACRAFLDR